MTAKRKRHKPPTLLAVIGPYICGLWESPHGLAVVIDDGKGNGIVIPSAIGTALTGVPKEAPVVEIPWEGFGKIQGMATVAMAAAQNKAISPRAEYFDRLFSHPIWLRLVAPLRGLK